MVLRSRPSTIVFVGPDGAGKSSIADALTRHARAQGVSVHHIHFRPHISSHKDLPRRATTVSSPHDREPRSLLVSLLKISLFFVIYWFAYISRLQRRAKAGLVIIERGWFDMYVDPRRYRLPYSIRPVVFHLGALLPDSMLVVLMSGDPTHISERKEELSIHETKRQIDLWKQLLPQLSTHSIELDTTDPTTGTAELAGTIFDMIRDG